MIIEPIQYVTSVAFQRVFVESSSLHDVDGSSHVLQPLVRATRWQ